MAKAASRSVLHYYEQHAELIARHLAGRRVRRYPNLVEAPVRSAQDVRAATADGTTGFQTSAGAGNDVVDRVIISVQTGDGADLATTATAALALIDRFAAEGRVAVAVLDGADGMFLVAPQPAGSAALARQHAEELIAEYASLAPEIATLDPLRADGRVLLSAALTDPDAFAFAPYSLVPGSWPGAVVPVHRDDVAAASAGMPLEVEPEDVARRLELRGDVLADHAS